MSLNNAVVSRCTKRVSVLSTSGLSFHHAFQCNVAPTVFYDKLITLVCRREGFDILTVVDDFSAQVGEPSVPLKF